jgi:hypothetical protein
MRKTAATNEANDQAALEARVLGEVQARAQAAVSHLAACCEFDDETAGALFGRLVAAARFGDPYGGEGRMRRMTEALREFEDLRDALAAPDVEALTVGGEILEIIEAGAKELMARYSYDRDVAGDILLNLVRASEGEEGDPAKRDLTAEERLARVAVALRNNIGESYEPWDGGDVDDGVDE